MCWLQCSAVVVLLAVSPRSSEETIQHSTEAQREQAAVVLDKALEGVESAGAADQQLAFLRSAAEEASKLVPANVYLSEVRETAQATPTDIPAAVQRVRAALASARDGLRFKPLIEAPLPEGFPEPTPVGEIRVQHYPEYRLAQTAMTFFESGAFWTLFNHIKKHDIAMTAPVEMQYERDAGDTLKRTSMAFLYRSTQQGEPGIDDQVKVVDIPAQTAVSIGLQGDTTRQRVADAKRRLEDWLKAHAADYEQAGPLRVLGYNSPFVPDEKRLTEVQFPIRQKKS